MSYKTILVHIDESKHLASRLNLALQIAMREKSHLIGIAVTGVSRFLNKIVANNVNDPT